MMEYSVRVPVSIIIERKTLIEHEIPEDGGIAPFDVFQINPNFDQVVVLLSPTVDNLKKLKDIILTNV